MKRMALSPLNEWSRFSRCSNDDACRYSRHFASRFIAYDLAPKRRGMSRRARTISERQPAARYPMTSPYTAHNVDAAIVHLERVLSAEGANSLFGQTYWRRRVQQVSATRGLQRDQRIRLERLLKLLADTSGRALRQ